LFFFSDLNIMRLHATPTTRLRTAFRYLSAASLLTATAAARSQALDPRPVEQVLGKPFSKVLEDIEAADSMRRSGLVETLHTQLRSYGRAIVEDSTVYFAYFGKATRVSVASDLNGWNPRADTMKRVARTDLFVLSKQLPPAARLEYKLVVDSVWMLDPINQQQAMGGYGPNSEVWMPLYRPPKEIEYRPDIPHGKLDTLAFTSKKLRRTHPIYVYLPHGYRKSSQTRYPTLYVNDGGEYISLALMPNVLDNLIAEKRIPPIVVVFIDPRTDPSDARTSKRMVDYTLSDTYVRFLVDELHPHVSKRYKITTQAEQTGIMGASLGGLIATYAAFKRPDVFGLCAAQSPAYWWANDSIITLIASAPRKDVRFYIDTGTLHDAQEKAAQMKRVLEEKGYPVHYEEHPEGHNWVNWRARLSHILEYFWKKP